MNKFFIAIVLILVVGWIISDNKTTPPGNTPPVATSTVPNSKSDLIVVDAPTPNIVVNSPFVIHGKARGYWFFEASFPIELRDMQGNVLQVMVAQAQSEWMTTEFVPFNVNLIFAKPAAPMQAILVFKKDNPSGLPENDDAIEIPITIQ